MCAAAAAGAAVPPGIWMTAKMRRELERNIYKITVPGPVAASMAVTEPELEKREKDLVAGIYNWVSLETKEREALRLAKSREEAGLDYKSANSRIIAAPVNDMVDHEPILKLEAGAQARLASASDGGGGDDATADDVSEGGSGAPEAAGKAEKELESVVIQQFDLIEKLHAELLRPMSGIRAELSQPSIITMAERTNINDRVAELAADPEATADLATFLRFWSRVKPLFHVTGAGNCAIGAFSLPSLLSLSLLLRLSLVKTNRAQSKARHRITTFARPDKTAARLSCVFPRHDLLCRMGIVNAGQIGARPTPSEMGFGWLARGFMTRSVLL